MLLLHRFPVSARGFEMIEKRAIKRLRQNRNPIFVALARTNENGSALKIPIFHAQTLALEKPQTRAVKQRSHQLMRRLSLPQQTPNFVTTQHIGRAPRAEQPRSPTRCPKLPDKDKLARQTPNFALKRPLAFRPPDASETPRLRVRPSLRDAAYEIPDNAEHNKGRILRCED